MSKKQREELDVQVRAVMLDREKLTGELKGLKADVKEKRVTLGECRAAALSISLILDNGGDASQIRQHINAILTATNDDGFTRDEEGWGPSVLAGAAPLAARILELETAGRNLGLIYSDGENSRGPSSPYVIFHPPPGHSATTWSGHKDAYKDAERTKAAIEKFLDVLGDGDQDEAVHDAMAAEKADDAEKAKRPVILVTWTESERGWGHRPDGFSLHATKGVRDAYIKAYWDDQPDRVGGAAPDEYSSPDGNGTIIEVDEDIYRKVMMGKGSEQGSFRSYDRDLLAKLLKG